MVNNDGEDCSSCDYSEEYKMMGSKMLRCKRYPKVFVGSDSLGTKWAYPVVKKFDWCGEWRSE